MSVVTILPGGAATSRNLKANDTTSLRSMETIYSIPSSRVSVLTRRKISQRNRERSSTLVPAVSEIKQRVVSARMLRIKQLQNQIGETQHRLSEIMTENRTLKALQRRHESALSRHEGPSAQLPQLLNSHAEELRMWTTRCRNLQQKNADLQAKLKSKEQIIQTVSDQNKQLQMLDKSKNLLERATLHDRMRVLEDALVDKEKEISLLVRRLQLAEKAYKNSLHMEQQKYRELLTKIEMSDLLLSTESHAKKVSPKVSLRRGIAHNKSPSNRLSSKSANALHSSSHMAEKKIENNDLDSNSTVLPPCLVRDDDAKPEETEVKHNTPNVVVNHNVKLLTIKCDDSNEGAIDEVDLTKNCIDKSEKLLAEKVKDEEGKKVVNGGEEENAVVRVKNGMHRARQQIQTVKSIAPSKLSQAHGTQQQPAVKKGEKKTTSDESEFSDDDFHFYSIHNGTKMAQLLEHKMHIAELESKMKQNSVDKHSSSFQHDDSSNSSLSSHEAAKSENATSAAAAARQLHLHHHQELAFKDRGDSSDLVSIQRQIHENILHHESILDEFCERLADTNDSFYSGTRANFASLAITANGGRSSKVLPSQPYQAIDHHKTNGHAAGGGGGGGGRGATGANETAKGSLDEHKKSKLLAALKNIENDSVEN